MAALLGIGTMGTTAMAMGGGGVDRSEAVAEEEKVPSGKATQNSRVSSKAVSYTHLDVYKRQGLLGSALSALPAGCGVVIYYFIRFVHAQSAALSDPAAEITEKLKLISDGLVHNWAMWITVIAFVVVILFVNLLRTRAFDYAWRIAVIAGGVIYILVILAGDFCLSITVAMVPMILSTVISVLAGFVLEFFVFGGDYSRTERLEYEDDEYYYYVKAVPKASVATSERSIKKINAEPVKEEKKEDNVVSFSDDVFPEKNEMHTVKMPDMVSENTVSEKPQGLDKIDFEKQLEESLKDL